MQYAISLSPRQTKRVLDQFTHASAQVMIEPIGLPDRALVGFVAQGDDDVLIVELTGRTQPWINELVGRCVGVQVFADDRYLFNTNIVRGPAWFDGERIALQTPRVVQVMQRRQFWRSQLAPSSQVTLTWETGSGRKTSLTAALLNVSCEGLACKMDESAARAIGVGTPLNVSFALPGTTTRFHFEAVVRNQTPTSEGGCIVGTQFERFSEDPDNEAMFSRLSEFLYRPREVQTAVGAPR